MGLSCIENYHSILGLSLTQHSSGPAREAVQATQLLRYAELHLTQ
jgi:hypothetical protein